MIAPFRNILFVLFAVWLSQTHAAGIHGTVSGVITRYSSVWKPRLYVSRIGSIDDLYNANASLRILQVPIDSKGRFSFSTREFGTTLQFYRLYVLPENKHVSECIQFAPRNFLLLLLNDTTSAHVVIPDAAAGLLYQVSGSTHTNTALAEFLNTFYGKSQPSDIDFRKTLRQYIAAHDPIVAAAAYRQMHFRDERLPKEERQFWRTQLSRLDEHYPQLSYTNDIRVSIARFNPSLLTGTYLFLLIGIILLLSLFLWFRYRRSRKKKVRPVSSDSERLALLTLRERTILKAITDGRSNQEIADELHIEVSTVKTHVRSIFRKLEIGSRKEAFRFMTPGEAL